LSGVNYCDGYLPFCIPTEVGGKDIELWDGSTTFEDVIYREGENPDDPFGEQVITLASNSSSEYIPVVGNGCGWVEIDINTACELYWRARALTFTEESITGTITSQSFYQTPVLAEVTATRINGVLDENIQNEGSLVCSKKSPWESLFPLLSGGWPRFDFEATMQSIDSGEPDYEFIGNFPVDPFVNGSVVIEPQFVDEFGFQVLGYTTDGTGLNFRQIKEQPDRVYVALVSLFGPPIFQYITRYNFLNGDPVNAGISIVSGDAVGIFRTTDFTGFSSLFELTDQSTTITILGKSNSVRVIKYTDAVYSPDGFYTINEIKDLLRQHYPTIFSYPNLGIKALEYFTYGGIYDKDTGEQV
jgi:hypothetical protein